MKKITMPGFIIILLCIVVVCTVTATPIVTAHPVVKSTISFAKISPPASITRFQPYFQTTPMTRTFTGDDNGKTFTVSKGQVVMIRLDENPTTGFMWEPTVSPGISIIGNSYKTSGNNRFASGRAIMTGSGGVLTWTLEMTSTGDQQFSADYKRSWMPGVEETYTIYFTVV